MKFDKANLFVYEDELFQGETLESVLRRDSVFRMSGLRDLAEVLSVIEEAMAQYPVLVWKERDFGEVDPVWLESTGSTREFGRAIRLNTFVSQSKPQHKRESFGELINRPTTFSLATSQLFRSDYSPWAGDHIPYKNQVYEVTRVYVDPEDYYQQSTFPLYVRVDTKVANSDSRLVNNCGGSFLGEAEMGSPSPSAPGTQSPFIIKKPGLPLLTPP